MWRPWGKETKDANTQVPKSYKKSSKTDSAIENKLSICVFIYRQVYKSISLYIYINTHAYIYKILIGMQRYRTYR